MAFAKSSSALAQRPRTRGPLVSKARLEQARERGRALARRAREAAETDSDALVQLGTAVGLSYLEGRGTLPKQIAGFDSQLVIGVAGYALLRKQKSKQMALLRQAALAAATVGASRSMARGSVRVSGDGSGEEDDDEI